MSTKPATITDVARQAGVSIATVSRVLNATLPVSEELRAKVFAAADALQYRPNRLAQNLRRGNSAAVGVIIPNIGSTFFAGLFKGVERTCFEHGRTVYQCSADDDPEKEVLYTEQLLSMGVEGIIYAGAYGWDYQDHIGDACARGVPIAVINRDGIDHRVDLVIIDRTRGNFLATSHLISLGHQTIGCITVLSPGGAGHEQLRGYRQAFSEAGLKVREALIVESSPSMEGAYAAARLMLERPDPPSAIFVRSDEMAIAVVRAALDRGLRVPQDLSIVGFGDIPMAQYYNPPLTTIRQPQQEMGMQAAKMLFERIENRDLPTRQALVEPSLVLRQSTARRQKEPKRATNQISFYS